MLGVYVKKGCHFQLAVTPVAACGMGWGVGKAGSRFSPLVRNGSCKLQDYSPPPSSCLRNSFPSNPLNNPHHLRGRGSEVLPKKTPEQAREKNVITKHVPLSSVWTTEY